VINFQSAKKKPRPKKRPRFLSILSFLSSGSTLVYKDLVPLRQYSLLALGQVPRVQHLIFRDVNERLARPKCFGNIYTLFS
jgi:hypothetical protein